MTKDLISLKHLTASEIEYIYEMAADFKAGVGDFEKPLDGMSIGLIFQKPSNRTRLSFEVGVYELGGHSVYLGPGDIQLGVRESIKDVALVHSRYLDGIIARTFSHDDIVALGDSATIPVINGLSDLLHPCQALSDIFTLREKTGKSAGLTLSYVGDGNNVFHSLMYACALCGVDLRFATPAGYGPNDQITDDARRMAGSSGSRIESFKSAEEAARGADAVYTDVWASMGQESEHQKRMADFKEYQVNESVFSKAKNGAFFMHCLPVHRGEEVTGSIIDGASSIVLEQAENRLYVQKAVMAVFIGRKKRSL